MPAPKNLSLNPPAGGKKRKVAVRRKTKKIPKPEVFAEQPPADDNFISALAGFSDERKDEPEKKLNLNLHASRLGQGTENTNILEKAKEMMGAKEPPRPKHTSAGLSLYRKIALTFIFLVLVLLGVVFYFSFVKLRIVVIPSQEKISDSLTFSVANASAGGGQGSISGVIDKFNLIEEMQVPATGEKVLNEEVGGKVTVYNKYIKNQPLVASTRLLAADGKLFRTKETVNVPAGGSVSVDIYADKPEANMVIKPGRFTIPGLWAGLQDKIYAESAEVLAVKKDSKKFITDEDIKNGIELAKKGLLARAQEAANVKYPQYDSVLFKINDQALKMETDAKANEEKDNFTVKLETQVEIAAFSKNDSVGLVKEKFGLTMPQGRQLVGFNGEEISYELAGIDTQTGSAEVKANFSGKVSLKEGAKILNPDELAGLTRAQLEEYLKNKEEIADYEIKFYPSFVRRVPTLLDRIEIQILKE